MQKKVEIFVTVEKGRIPALVSKSCSAYGTQKPASLQENLNLILCLAGHTLPPLVKGVARGPHGSFSRSSVATLVASQKLCTYSWMLSPIAL